MSSTYIEDFLEQTNNLPRELTRNMKQIRETDEKYTKSQERLTKFRNQFINILKAKAKGKIIMKLEGIKTMYNSDQDVLKSIISEFDNTIQLSDYKIEIANECIYLVEYNLRKLNQLIENFESNLKQQQNSQTEIAKTLKISQDKMAENFLVAGKSKVIADETEKEEKFLNRKKLHLSKKNKNLDNTSDQVVNSNTTIFNEPNITDNNAEKEIIETKEEPIYCFCRNFSYGKMVECDNRNCQYQWFHFDCVGLTSLPKGKWFCSSECKQSYKKKK